MKKLTAVFLTVLTVLTFVSCEKSKSEDHTKNTFVSTSSPIAPTEEKNNVDEKVSEVETLEKNVFQIAQENQWKTAYADYFSDTSIYSSVYVYDVNRDGIPEVFSISYSPPDLGQQVAAYNRDRGDISTFKFDFHISLALSPGTQLYLERYRNVVVLREDGQSTSNYDFHHAVIYSLETTGFVKKDEIWGEQSENIYDENSAIEPRITKSLELFDKKYLEFTRGLDLINYEDVAVSDNIKAYLVNKLGLNER